MKKTVQVIMLPTNQNKIEEGQLFSCYSKLGIARGSFLDTQDYKPQHLYFTSNEEIKEGDYVYIESYNNTVIQNIHGSIGSVIGGGKYLRDYCKKIIATTDKSLKLPLIPQSFIEDYVKSNGEIKEVEYIVDKTLNNGDEIGIQYKNTIYYIKGKLAIEYLLTKPQECVLGKQTLEEAAEEYAGDVIEKSIKGIYYEAFIAGAKWQQLNS